jgi:hypothetical protein
LILDPPVGTALAGGNADDKPAHRVPYPRL